MRGRELEVEIYSWRVRGLRGTSFGIKELREVEVRYEGRAMGRSERPVAGFGEWEREN